MLEILINISNFLSPIFYKVLYMSLIGSIVGILMLGITQLFDNKLSAKWKCAIWMIPVIFLMIPISRIEINTQKNFPITSIVDKVETSFIQTTPAVLKEVVKSENDTVQSINATKASTNTENNTTNSSLTWYTLLPMIWIVGTSASILIIIIGNINLIKKTSKDKKVEDSRIYLILMNCKRRLQINKTIGIRLQNGNLSPCIYGIIKPNILVSKEFIENSDEVIENVFMHELSHYKRKDMMTNIILLIMTSLHWFNPFVYRFFKKIRQEMELATDEIALSRMDKEQKKQYGLTLISLLQTYETQKVATKMLCITDDNKNMERRIEKIKWSTKLKKYKMSIIIFVILILGCIVSPFIIKLSNNNTKVANSNKQKPYEIVRQYLIKKEEENHHIGREEFATNGDDFKTFIDMAELGIEENGDETYVYVWALIESYSVQEELTSTGSSMPYKFTIKDNNIIKCEIPEDGEGYAKSIEKIFPKEIRKKMKDSESLVNQEKLEAEAKKYYEYLGNNGDFTNTNIEHTTDKLVGKWKPYKAEYKGKEMNLRDVYGSGITYGGELILNKDNTYTEFIGIYSEDNVNDLQGTYRTYGTGEKALLTTNNGETKTLELLESGENSIIVLTNSDGRRIYFTK